METLIQLLRNSSVWKGVMVLGILVIIGACSTNSEDGSENTRMFESDRISSGNSFSYTFEETGTFDYYCDIHQPDMNGQVTVQSGAADSGQVTVEMENSRFMPEEIIIAPQTTVRWINNDDFDHIVVSGEAGTGSGGNGGGDGGGY